MSQLYTGPQRFSDLPATLRYLLGCAAVAAVSVLAFCAQVLSKAIDR